MNWAQFEQIFIHSLFKAIGNNMRHLWIKNAKGVPTRHNIKIVKMTCFKGFRPRKWVSRPANENWKNWRHFRSRIISSPPKHQQRFTKKRFLIHIIFENFFQNIWILILSRFTLTYSKRRVQHRCSLRYHKFIKKKTLQP